MTVELDTSKPSPIGVLTLDGAGPGRSTPAQVRELLNVENGATADQTPEEIVGAYSAQVPIVSQADAEAGAAATVHRWTAQRVAQAIAALAPAVSGVAATAANWRGTGPETLNEATLALQAAAASGVSDGDKGDITVTGSGATWTIDNSVVTNTKMANMATARFKARITTGTGVAEDITAAEARTLLNVEDGADVTDATNVAAAGAVMTAGAQLVSAQANNTLTANAKLWAGSQAHYDALTPTAGELYFIVGA